MAKAKKPSSPTAEEYQELAKVALGLTKLVAQLNRENRRLLTQLYGVKES